MNIPRYDPELYKCCMFAKKLMKDHDFLEAISIASKYYEQDFYEVRDCFSKHKPKIYYVPFIEMGYSQEGSQQWVIKSGIRTEMKRDTVKRGVREFKYNRRNSSGSYYASETNTFTYGFFETEEEAKKILQEKLKEINV